MKQSDCCNPNLRRVRRLQRTAGFALFVAPLLVVLCSNGQAVRAEEKLEATARPEAAVQGTPATVSPDASAVPAPAADGTSVGDPIVTRVRVRLAESRAPGDRDDRQALASFYRDRVGAAVWVSATGLTPHGKAAASELARASEWGLVASDYTLPEMTSAGTDDNRRADEEIAIGLAVLKYARHARGGRLDPTALSRFFDQKPSVKPALEVLREIVSAPATDAYLRGLHPQHPQFELLRQALLKARSGAASAQPMAEGEPDVSAKVSDGPAVKSGQQHKSVADLRKRLGVVTGDLSKALVLDDRLVEALKAFQRGAGLSASGTLDKETRTALNKAPRAETAAAGIERLVANMERWRWMPTEMGAFHVWDNIPELTARVVKAGETVHQARIVVGKTETQTPLFSAEMRYIVFHPGWGVPDSIKVKELLPYLRPTQSFFGFGETDTAVLRRHGLTVNLNGKAVDPATINWQQVDIRRYSFIQPPGAANVLGQLKFRFPNKHDVYMHDTSQRDLFQRSQRTFSHGCVRVENPQRLAEVLLDHDRGMPATEIARLLASGPKDNQIELKTKIPVHITYFTIIAAADGSTKTFADFYGHDVRVTTALAGKPMPLERGNEVAETARRPVKQAQQASKPNGGGGDLFSGLFGN